MLGPSHCQFAFLQALSCQKVDKICQQFRSVFMYILGKLLQQNCTEGGLTVFCWVCWDFVITRDWTKCTYIMLRLGKLLHKLVNIFQIYWNCFELHFVKCMVTLCGTDLLQKTLYICYESLIILTERAWLWKQFWHPSQTQK